MFKEKFERRETVNPSINTEDMEFVKIEELQGKTVRLWGYFFTQGKYGTQVVGVAKDCLINLPKRYTENFQSLSKDETLAVMQGDLVLSDIRALETKQGDTFIFDFEDIGNFSEKDIKKMN